MNKENWALLSVTINLFQSAIKFVGAILTGSLSMLGEAIHSLSDSTASIIAYISIKFSEKKHHRFPYGLYKLENIGAIVIGFFLIIAGFEIGKRAFEERIVINKEHLPVAILIMVVSLSLSLTLSFFERRAGKRLHSPTLVADSYHTLTDAFGSFLVILSLSASRFGYEYDRYFALAIAGLIGFTAINMLREQIGFILDISADKETVERIRNIILSFDDVVEIKRLLVREAGGRIFIDTTITIKAKDFIKSHNIADAIERKIVEEIPQVHSVFIHYEPHDDGGLRIAVLVDDKDGIAESFGSAKKIMIFKGGEGPEVLEPNSRDEIEIAKILGNLNVDIVISGHHPRDSRAKWYLHKNGIFVWEPESKNIYEAISEITKNV